MFSFIPSLCVILFLLFIFIQVLYQSRRSGFPRGPVYFIRAMHISVYVFIHPVVVMLFVFIFIHVLYQSRRSGLPSDPVYFIRSMCFWGFQLNAHGDHLIECVCEYPYGYTGAICMSLVVYCYVLIYTELGSSSCSRNSSPTLQQALYTEPVIFQSPASRQC